MFTTRQGTRMEGQAGMDPRNRAAPAVGFPWARSTRQHLLTPRRFPGRGMVVLWLSDPGLPAPTDVHGVVMVKDLRSALRAALRQEYTLAIEPVTVTAGTCAVVQDGSGFRLCLLEQTRAP